MVATIFLSNVNTTIFAVNNDKIFTNTNELNLSFDNTIKDSSKNNIKSIFNGDEVYVNGVSGKAISLNGVSNYIDLGTTDRLQPENLTMSCWINPSESLGGREHMLMWNKPNGNFYGNGWYLTILNTSTPLKLSIGNSFQEAYVNENLDEFFPLNTWTHIAVTFNEETKEVKIYRNGIAQKVNYVNKITNSIVSDNEENKYLGFNSPKYNGGYSKLSVDEFKIYSSVADELDVVNLYTEFGADFDEQAIIDEDVKNLSILTEDITSDLYLPTKGEAGSEITWISSDSRYINNEGKVIRPGIGEGDVTVTLTATITFGEKYAEKKFDVKILAESHFITLKDFNMDKVETLDDYYINSLNKEIEYLKEYDSDRLLAGFFETRGLEPKGTKYPGWESTEIRGHTLGHYLTAIAQAYENSKDEELLNKINYIIDGLSISQFDSGYLSAFPETLFDNVESSKPAWVPWYTMHKIIAGLIDVYKLTDNEKAYDISVKLGEWVYNRTSKWTPQVQNTVLSVEYGGMNDCLYELYKISGNENYIDAAHKFDEVNLFTSIQQGNDILNGKHANTTIPKFLGALNRYRVLGEGEEFYLQAAESFWDIVVNNHTYITGGNSEWEHLGESRKLDIERTDCNCETCNTYNMLKLSRELFKITGNVKYADYYENTIINAILSSQNPETGMTTYFQPMATGYFKVYSTPFDKFWCCTGTGMENFTKLNDSIYFYDENNSLYVNQYVSSTLKWTENNMKITQDSTIPNSDTTKLIIETLDGNDTSANIKIRVPNWIEGKANITINGEEIENKITSGYISLNREWVSGDVIEIKFSMKVGAYDLPDNEHVVAFKYGPIVLSAGLGSEDMVESSTGVDVTIPTKNIIIKDFITVNDDINQWIDNIENNLVKTENKLEFTLRNTYEDNNLIFSPHYMQYEERYGIYWNIVEEDSELLQNHILITKVNSRREEAKIDSLPVGNDQYELHHNIQGENTAATTYGGYNLRHAWKDGWFSYEMKVDSAITNYLLIKYYSGDHGRTFDIYIDDELLINETLENVDPGKFYDKSYEIPSKMVEDKKQVTVKFVTRGNSYVGGVFDVFSVIRAFNDNASLSSLTFNSGRLSEDFSNDITDYTLYVLEETTEVIMNVTPYNKNGLVYLNDILIDDTLDRKIKLNNDAETEIQIVSKAENHETEKIYNIKIVKEKEMVKIVNIKDISDIHTKIGAKPVLPKTIGVQYSDNTEGEVK
ncbi:beta-L-arabinofuranosidase domain-containing protein [Clostridium sp.]|uniref:beta-L-arabinofuranosidase domain-containing protein n=1 Tax=Clostridium sp. TaxID=1506 RepID=UPI001D89AFF6|nr:beta-L-arabinofuranosidase domain-containing protein [Clostridium sp.]MBS5937642.1 glycoside hydrolase family 127 protein [Clostridium sp.]